MNLLRFVTRLSFFLTLCVFIACDEQESTVKENKDYEYMPLHKGVYQLYSVSETTYTLNNPNGLSKKYELLVEVVDSFPTSPHSYTYIIYLSTRPTEVSAWTYTDTWTAHRNSREVIVQEGNTPFVKFVLPTFQNRVWDGNLYNTLGEDEYEISRVTDAETINNLEFTDVMEVTQSNEVDNIVGNDVRVELYAKGVGLVKKKTETITYCSNTPNCLGKKIIEEGVVVEQTLKTYGKK